MGGGVGRSETQSTHLAVVAALSVGAHGVSRQGARCGVATRVQTLLQQGNKEQQVTAGRPDLPSAGTSGVGGRFLCGLWEGSGRVYPDPLRYGVT